jgi:hypothetical protein
MVTSRFDDVLPDGALEQLSAGIVEPIKIDPPDIKESLRPPRLRIANGQGQGIKSYTAVAKGIPIILLGEDLYPVIRHFCRAAATFFLPGETGDRRPSELWPQARAALATIVDWCTSPAATPRLPDFDVTARQEAIGNSMADLAYRFVLCHEMAHVALEHVQAGALDLEADGEDNVEVLRASQERELEADRFGLRLQVGSLSPELFVSAMASAVYYTYFLRIFDDYRLMLLGQLVDHEAWRIEYSHPPYLHRVFNLMQAAHTMFGKSASDGIQSLQGDLEGFIGELGQACQDNQDSVAENARLLLENSSPGPQELAEILKLLEQSPIGVLRALDEAATAGESVDSVVEALPVEFREFLRQDPAERSRQLA